MRQVFGPMPNHQLDPSKEPFWGEANLPIIKLAAERSANDQFWTPCWALDSERSSSNSLDTPTNTACLISHASGSGLICEGASALQVASFVKLYLIDQ